MSPWLRTHGPGSRLYNVPFERVWKAATSLLSPERGWSVIVADPTAGTIHVERPSRILRRPLHFHLAMELDENGFTRVDAVFLTPDGERRALGKRRRARRILRRLDRALAT
jgi:hypothetical protein